MQSARMKPPFGIAQIGKAFRNEIRRATSSSARASSSRWAGFFTPPGEAMEWFERFREIRMRWHHDISLDPAKLRWHARSADSRALREGGL